MRRKKKGFTIVEMFVVIAIIGLIATLIVPKFFKGMGEQKRKVAKAKMATIEDAISRFNFDCGRMPEVLDDLITAPEDFEEGKWKGRYLKPSQLLDPWDMPYIYMPEGEINVGSFDLISYGADKTPGGEGDGEDIYND